MEEHILFNDIFISDNFYLWTLNKRPKELLSKADLKFLTTHKQMEDFEQIFANEYGSGYTDDEKGILILKATNDYIPIRNFKQLFGMLGDQVKDNPGVYSKFIFDKSTLRTFHQPSMKWYFQEWKTEMLDHGLAKHVKILPDLGYFKKAVEAARKPLLAKYPKDILSKLSIEYADDMEQAVTM